MRPSLSGLRKWWGTTMQDITPSDDAQRRMQLSTLYQNQPPYETGPEGLPPSSSDASYPNIENLYLFREANEVQGFLEENPFLVPLLQEARIHIKEYFPDSDVVLEVITDPEIMGEKELVASIVAGQNVEEACETLKQLNEDWWLDTLDRAEDQLHIGLEFR